ncbi:membrane protein [Microbacterium awajiense]|uniref:Membrane protein n=1 Tax=Microbacterium awajiense TaxID=415214 RepID=A0ABP7AVN1_9MICO
MTDNSNVTGWVGWGYFAATVLLIAGIFDTIQGFVAILAPDSAYFVLDGTLFVFDLQGWGWWTLLIGLLLVLVAIALFLGATWARVVAVILAILSAVGHLFTIPAQPWWSLIVIALDVLIIYALTVHGREMKARG